MPPFCPCFIAVHRRLSDRLPVYLCTFLVRPVTLSIPSILPTSDQAVFVALPVVTAVAAPAFRLLAPDIAAAPLCHSTVEIAGSDLAYVARHLGK